MKICKHCGRGFQGAVPWLKYCCKACSIAARGYR